MKNRRGWASAPSDQRKGTKKRGPRGAQRAGFAPTGEPKKLRS